MGGSNSSSAEDLGKFDEKEVDFDNIFGTSQYIFLEEHYKAETYNYNLLTTIVSTFDNKASTDSKMQASHYL
jgi:hypothetical protein